MSSILDALEKLESAPPAAAPGGPPPPPARRRLVVVAGVLVAFLAGVGIAAWLMRAPAPVVAAVPEPAPAPEPPRGPAAPEMPAPMPPPARPPVARERPWVEVVEDAPEPAPQAAPPGAATPSPVPEPFVGTRRDPRAVPTAKGGLLPPVSPRPAPTPAAKPAPARTPRPGGAPEVRISFLIYSRTPERRSVALTIDGTGLVTLREGQAAQGLEVVEILPDGARVTWQGQRFTVPARN